MFTGIVTELGRVVGLDGDDVVRIEVEAPNTCDGLVVGDSIAVNGVCLTAVDIEADRFAVEAVPETMARSSLGSLATGGVVNLERPMLAHGRFDGHIVQGHVDGVGTIASMIEEGGSIRVRVTVPALLARYVVEKGSIAVDGTSLTVTAVSDVGEDPSWFDVVLIPHTLEVTVFGSKGVGDPVNLEVDVIAKYVERMMGEMS